MLRRWQLPHLGHVDRLTGEIVRRRATDLRYERDRPGELPRVDVKKIGRVPDGGGWRVHGRSVDDGRRGHGWDFVHAPSTTAPASPMPKF